MSEVSFQFTIKRIMVALDASADSLSALQAAADIAAAMHAELEGLFVEDVELLHMATLPFTLEIQRTTGLQRTIDHESMEYDLRLQASLARRALANAAERAEAKWTFRVVRGNVSRELLSAASDSGADLLSLGRRSRSLFRRPPLGSTAKAVITDGPRYIFLAGPAGEEEQPVMVTFDGAPTAEKALLTAADFAALYDSELLVLIVQGQPGSEGPSGTELAQRCDELLAERDLKGGLGFRTLHSEKSRPLLDAAAQNQCSLLVLGGAAEWLQGKTLHALLDDLSCPILLVR